MRSANAGFRHFLYLIGILFVLRVVLAFVAVPVHLSEALSIVSSIVYVAVPLFGLCKAACGDWVLRHGIIVLAVGAVMHVATAVLVRFVLPVDGLPTVLAYAVAQSGILLWTFGLGVLTSLLISDRNLMVPVAVFLIGFDMFLVFTPTAPTAVLVRKESVVTQVGLATVPAVKSEGQPTGRVRDLAYIGPADLLFSAAFFCLLFRFRMRTRATFFWLAPVLVLYLMVILIFGDTHLGPISLRMLPAMVPIGLTLLLVNRREFSFKRHEAIGVGLVTVVSLAFAAYGVYRAAIDHKSQVPQVGPSPPGRAQALPEPEGSPAPAP